MESGNKALVIDDEPSIVRFCRKVLEGMGFEVSSTGDGYLAMEMVDKTDFELILVDIRLPKMSGIELFTRLKKDDPDIASKIVFMTGSVMGRETGNFLDKNTCPYLLKPFRADQLREVIIESIGSSYPGKTDSAKRTG